MVQRQEEPPGVHLNMLSSEYCLLQHPAMHCEEAAQKSQSPRPPSLLGALQLLADSKGAHRRRPSEDSTLVQQPDEHWKLWVHSEEVGSRWEEIDKAEAARVDRAPQALLSSVNNSKSEKLLGTITSHHIEGIWKPLVTDIIAWMAPALDDWLPYSSTTSRFLNLPAKSIAVWRLVVSEDRS